MKTVRLPAKLPALASQDEIRAKLNETIDYMAWLHGIKQEPTIVDITDELLKHPTETYGTRSMADISQIVIHHVGVNAPVTPQQTARYHVNTKGWPGIAYHFFITSAGVIYQTNDLTTVSYHCAGTCNKISIGICLEGSFMIAQPTASQIESLYDLNAYLLSVLSMQPVQIRGHREVRQTACPGNTWEQWKPKVVPAA